MLILWCLLIFFLSIYKFAKIEFIAVKCSSISRNFFLEIEEMLEVIFNFKYLTKINIFSGIDFIYFYIVYVCFKITC